MIKKQEKYSTSLSPHYSHCHPFHNFSKLAQIIIFWKPFLLKYYSVNFLSFIIFIKLPDRTISICLVDKLCVNLKLRSEERFLI